MAQWAEGVLFVYSCLPSDTNGLMENYLEGKIFWSSANLALMPKYDPSIKVAGLEVPVIDVSKPPNLARGSEIAQEASKAEVDASVRLLFID